MSNTKQPSLPSKKKESYQVESTCRTRRSRTFSPGIKLSNSKRIPSQAKRHFQQPYHSPPLSNFHHNFLLVSPSPSPSPLAFLPWDNRMPYPSSCSSFSSERRRASGWKAGRRVGVLERFHSWPESLRASLASRRLSRYPESKASTTRRDKGE